MLPGAAGVPLVAAPPADVVGVGCAVPPSALAIGLGVLVGLGVAVGVSRGAVTVPAARVGVADGTGVAVLVGVLTGVLPGTTMIGVEVGKTGVAVAGGGAAVSAGGGCEAGVRVNGTV